MHDSTDVLVVGAGPVGLLLGAELRRDGVDVRVIDQHPQRAFFCKALGVTARTLGVFEDSVSPVAQSTRASGSPASKPGATVRRCPSRACRCRGTACPMARFRSRSTKPSGCSKPRLPSMAAKWTTAGRSTASPRPATWSTPRCPGRRARRARCTADGSSAATARTARCARDWGWP